MLILTFDAMFSFTADVTCRHANGTEFGLNICLEKLNMMPVLVEACYISCPTECQLTDWSVWSPCLRQGCEGRRFRSRNLLGVLCVF